MHQLSLIYIAFALIMQSILVCGQTDPSYLKGETWNDEAGAEVTTLYFTLGDGNWPNADPFRMVVIGDSIAWGCGLNKEEKYHYLVADWLQKTLKRPVEVTVLAHTGASIQKPTKDLSSILLGGSKHAFIDHEFGSWDPTLLEQANHIPNPGDVDLILVSGGINDVGLDKLLTPWPNSGTINARCQEIRASMINLLLKLLEKCDKSVIIVTDYYTIASDDTPSSSIRKFADCIRKNSKHPIEKLFSGPIGYSADIISDNCAEFNKKSRESLGDSEGGAVDRANEYSRANFGRDRVYFADVDFPPDRSYGTSKTLLWELVDADNGGRTNDHKYNYRVSLFDPEKCNWDDKIQAIAHPNVEGAEKYASAIEAVITSKGLNWQDNSPSAAIDSLFSRLMGIIDNIMGKGVIQETEYSTTTQDSSEGWIRTFGGTNEDGGSSIKQTSDGGFIMAGYTSYNNTAVTEAWLIKTDSEGNKLWQKTFANIDYDWIPLPLLDLLDFFWQEAFGRELSESADSVQQTNDGGYIISGSTRLKGAGGNDAWLIKTDSQGNEQWQKTFGGGRDDWASSVQQTSDGGYILAGGKASSSMGYADAWLIKTDSQGNEIWQKTFGGKGEDWASSVQQTSDGGYIIAGLIYSYDANDFSALLIKTDSQGNKLWQKTFSGRSQLYCIAGPVQQTSDGGYITGMVASRNSEARLIKTDSVGRKIWEKSLVGTNFRDICSLQQTSDDGYIITGISLLGPRNFNAWLIKTDSEGNELWRKIFGGLKNDWAFSVQQISNGYIMAGKTESSGSGSSDAWLIKTDINGDVKYANND